VDQVLVLVLVLILVGLVLVNVTDVSTLIIYFDTVSVKIGKIADFTHIYESPSQGDPCEFMHGLYTLLEFTDPELSFFR